MLEFFKRLNWKQHLAFLVIYPVCYVICYKLTMAFPNTFSQSCLGMLDNGPLIYLGFLAVDPQGPVMGWFRRLNCDGPWMGWVKNPVFLVVFVNAILNTGTDAIGAGGDPTSSFIGVTFGCLIVLVMLPITWRLRTPRIQSRQTNQWVA